MIYTKLAKCSIKRMNGNKKFENLKKKQHEPYDDAILILGNKQI